MRLLFGLLSLLGAAQLQAASREILMTFRAGTADYVPLQEPVFDATTGVGSLRNLDSYVVKYRAWSLIGEYVYVAAFYYARNPRELQGAKRTVRFGQISKYPDLVKRYNAIRPSSVAFTIWASVETESAGREMRFKVTDNDLVYFGSRSGENYATPGSPPRWKDAVSFDEVNPFTAADATTDAELKKFLRSFRGFARLTPPRVFLEVKWPEGEIDSIGNLFDQYEKEGEKLKEDYAFLDDAPKEPPFAGRREEAEPHDFRLKPGEAFREGNEVGIKVNGRLVFRSTRHAHVNEFDARKTHFYLSERGADGSEIYDTKGRQVKVAGYARVAPHTPSARGNPRVIGIGDATSPAAYRTQKQYYYGQETLNQQEFDDFVRRDRTPRPPRNDTGGGGVYLDATRYTYEYARVELLELDAKFNVMAREWVYRPRMIE